MDAKTKKSIQLALTLFLLGTSIITSYMWIFNQEAKGECDEEVQEVSQERDTILSEFADLEYEFDSISAEAYKNEIEIDELTSLRDSLRHELAMAIEQNKDDEKTIKGIREKMDELRDRYSAIADSIKSLNEDLEEANQTIDDQGNTIQIQEKEIEGLGEIIVGTEKELENEQDKNKRLQERAQKLQIEPEKIRFLNKNKKEITGFKATKYVQVSFEVSANAVRSKGNVTYFVALKNSLGILAKVGYASYNAGGKFYYSEKITKYFSGSKQTITVDIPYEALQGERLYAEILIAGDNEPFEIRSRTAP